MIEIPAQNAYCIIENKNPRRWPKESDKVFAKGVSRAHCKSEEIAKRFIDSDEQPVWVITLHYCAN
jgi:hypothetical protein